MAAWPRPAELAASPEKGNNSSGRIRSSHLASAVTPSSRRVSPSLVQLREVVAPSFLTARRPHTVRALVLVLGSTLASSRQN